MSEQFIINRPHAPNRANRHAQVGAPSIALQSAVSCGHSGERLTTHVEHALLPMLIAMLALLALIV